jgi:hypothetical protein
MLPIPNTQHTTTHTIQNTTYNTSTIHKDYNTTHNTHTVIVVVQERTGEEEGRRKVK